MPKKIPATILTGFLGSGKTTILNSIINNKLFKNTLVIVNEFGKISIDHHLIKKKSNDKIVLNNGCLCCSFSGDLVKTLDDTLKLKQKFDNIIIETSGLADPVPIIQTLVSDQIISEKIKFNLLVTIVDAVNFQNNYKNHLENFKQISAADILIISKSDLSSETKLKEIKVNLNKINPHSDVYDKNSLSIQSLIKLFKKINLKKITIDKLINKTKNNINYLHDHHSEKLNKINSISINYKNKITKEGLKLWLNALARFKSNNLLRMKGIIKVGRKVILINSVQKVFHEPVYLNKWPFKDKISKIIFITKNIEKKEIEKTLSVLSFKQAKKRKKSNLNFSKKDYSNFIKSMNSFDALKALDR